MESNEKNFADDYSAEGRGPVEEIKNPHPHRNTGLWIWVLIGFLTLGGCVFGAIIAIKSIGDFGDKIAEEIEEQISYDLKNESEDTGTKKADEKSNEMEYIGDDANGYVKVSRGLWTKVDTENSQSLRYYAGIYTLLITIVGDEPDKAFVYAQSLYDVAMDSPNVSNVTLNREQLAAYEESYKLVSKDELSGTWSVGWIFVASDNKVHYILVQGLDLEDERFTIPTSFVLEKPEE